MAKTNRTPQQLASDSALGGLTTRSRHTPGGLDGYTAAARAAAFAKFEDAVDPDRVLPEAERLARAVALQRARMRQLARKAARVRKAKRPRVVKAQPTQTPVEPERPHLTLVWESPPARTRR